MQRNFPAQIFFLQLHCYLNFINSKTFREGDKSLVDIAG